MSILTTAGLVSFLQMHGYIIMLAMMFLEGASVTYVSAFIASTGVFNIYIVILISILGFFAEDMILFYIGRHWGKKILKKYFHNTKSGRHLERLMTGIKNHSRKTIAIVKLSPIIPVPGLIMIGASDVPVKKFVYNSLLITIIYSLTLAALGYYSGMAIGALVNDITNNLWVLGIVVLLFIGIGYLTRYISRRIEDEG